MTRQQQRIAEAFNVRGYYHGVSPFRGPFVGSPEQRRAAFAEANRQLAMMPPIPGLGMGDVTSQQITNAVGSSLMSTGGVVAAIPGLQIPGAIIAAVGALTSLVGSFFKPDLTKIQASNIVNQIEAQVLIPMRSAWQSLPANQKTVSMQAHFLNIFDQAWSAVQQGCSNPALGSAGQACTADRQQGACHYTIDGQTPGVPPNCGNWFIWYRDVVANDPNVIPDPVLGSGAGPGSSVFGSVDSATSQVSSALGISPLAIGLGLIAGALILGSD